MFVIAAAVLASILCSNDLYGSVTSELRAFIGEAMCCCVLDANVCDCCCCSGIYSMR